MNVVLNGKIVDAKEASISVFDHGFLYGDGIYETLRTYGGKVFQLNDHLRRLAASAKSISLPMPYSQKKIGELVAKLVKKNGFEESRIRISVSRGENGFVFKGSKKPTLVIQCEEMKELPKKDYEQGVSVVTFKAARLMPEIKTTSLLPMVLGRQVAEKAKAHEALFVSETGDVLEGTVSNLFVVLGNVLVTPADGALSGTVRGLVVSLANKQGMKMNEGRVMVNQLMSATECFLTNSVKGIVPVKEIDGKKFGGDVPGPVTKRMMEMFDAHIEKFTKK